MKKIIYSTLALFLAVTSLSSCLKDDSTVLDPDKATGNVVEFGNTGTPTSPAGAPVFAYTPLTLDPTQTTASFTTLVRYSGAEDVAPEDITVTLAEDASLVTKWNAAYPTATAPNVYHHLPAGSFSFPSTVVIKKGTNHTNFDITIKTDMLDQSISNVFGIKIVSASHGTVSGNFGGIIYNLPIKSIWEGTYTYHVTCAQDAGLNSTQTDFHLSTIAPNRVQSDGGFGGYYSGYTNYQFNGDNSALTEVGAFSGSAIATVLVSYTLDVPNKNFTVVFTALGREIHETWTRTGD